NFWQKPNLFRGLRPAVPGIRREEWKRQCEQGHAQFPPDTISPEAPFPPRTPHADGGKTRRKMTTKRAAKMLTLCGSLLDLARPAQFFPKSAQHAASATPQLRTSRRTTPAQRPTTSR